MLDFGPTYQKNSATPGEYTKKRQKDKGLLIREAAGKTGTPRFILIKWEGGRIPAATKTFIQLNPFAPYMIPC
jgi:hypothetical protein